MSEHTREDADVAKVREAHAKAMEALAADANPYSASAIRVWEESLERALGRLAALVAQHRDTQEALGWALDVLEVSLKRIDTIDGAVLDDEHYRIRAAGLAKARAVLDDAALASVRARTPA